MAYVHSLINLDDRDLLESYWAPLRQKYRLPFAEFSFANIYLFRHKHTYHLSTEKPTPHVAGKRNGNPRYVIPNSFEELPDLLHSLESQPDLYVYPLSTEWKESLPKNYLFFKYEEDGDYIFSREKLQELKGRHLSSRRNLLHQLEREHAMQSIPLTDKNNSDAFAILETWETTKQENDPEHDDYSSAKEAIELVEPLHLFGRVAYADGRPAGFTIGEILNERHAVLLIAKGDRSFKGITPYLYEDFAKQLPPNIQWINLEQDLGNPGLRQAKRAYHPDNIVDKWYARKEKG